MKKKEERKKKMKSGNKNSPRLRRIKKYQECNKKAFEKVHLFIFIEMKKSTHLSKKKIEIKMWPPISPTSTTP